MGKTSDYLRSSGRGDASSNDGISAKAGVRREHASGLSILGSFFLGFLIAIILSWCMYFFNDETYNVIENNDLWNGYSEINVHQIIDAETGVVYAVTDTGDICVLLDENGNPKVSE